MAKEEQFEDKTGKNENDSVLLTGYVGIFGEANVAGDIIEKDTVVRAPKWLGTQVEKDEIGIKVMVAVPRSELPGMEPSPLIRKLEERNAALQKQATLPLSSHEIELLYKVLAEQKVKLGETVPLQEGSDLLAKLAEYLNPTLFPAQEETAKKELEKVPEDESEETDGATE